MVASNSVKVLSKDLEKLKQSIVTKNKRMRIRGIISSVKCCPILSTQTWTSITPWEPIYGLQTLCMGDIHLDIAIIENKITRYYFEGFGFCSEYILAYFKEE